MIPLTEEWVRANKVFANVLLYSSLTVLFSSPVWSLYLLISALVKFRWAVLLFVVAGVIAFIISGIKDDIKEEEQEKWRKKQKPEYKVWKIASLKKEDHISGSISGGGFLVGVYGSFSQYPKYVMYEIIDKNKYKLFKVDAGRVLIVEDDSREPQYIECVEFAENSKEFKDYRCQLIVPKGTIIKEFKL